MAIGATVYPTVSVHGFKHIRHPELIRRAGEEIALEARSTGAGVGYGPVLDIAREPRWSRMERLSAKTRGSAESWVQPWWRVCRVRRGSSVNDGRHLYSTLKHFAAYGVPEGGHNGAEASVGAGKASQRTSRTVPPRHCGRCGHSDEFLQQCGRDTLHRQP